jgi:hypothetical protein
MICRINQNSQYELTLENLIDMHLKARKQIYEALHIYNWHSCFTLNSLLVFGYLVARSEEVTELIKTGSLRFVRQYFVAN